MTIPTTPTATAGLAPVKVTAFLSRHREVLRLVVIVAALWTLLAILSPRFLTVSNFSNILINAAPLALAAAGLTIVIIAGELDLSVGSTVALVSTASGLLMVATGVAWPLALLLGVLVGALCGLVNGLIIALIGVPSFITTLAMMGAFRGIALVLSDGRAVSGLPSGLSQLASMRLLGLPVILLIPIVAIPVLGFLLSKTSFGLNVYAIGGNREAARIAGVPIARTRILVLVISGVMAGLGGLIMTARLGVGSPIIAESLAMDAIAAVVIGGTSLFGGVGRIGGTVMGVLLVASIQNGLVLLNVSTFYQQIVVGIVLVVAVAIDAVSKRRRNA